MSKKFIFLSLVSGLAACGSGSKEMTVAEFTKTISEKECANVTAACLLTDSTCRFTRETYWLDVASAAMKAGRPFDPSNADACLSKVTSVFGALKESLAIQASEYHQMNQTCSRVFHGPALELQACSADLDCVDGLFCDKGRCGKPSEVGPGKQCGNIGEYCSQGYICAEVSSVRQCVTRATRGSACTDDGSCMEVLRCSGGLCVDRLAVGLECQADQDCADGFCEPHTKLCGKDIRFAYGNPACLDYQPPSVAAPAATPDASVVD